QVNQPYSKGCFAQLFPPSVGSKRLSIRALREGAESTCGLMSAMGLIYGPRRRSSLEQVMTAAQLAAKRCEQLCLTQLCMFLCWFKRLVEIPTSQRYWNLSSQESSALAKLRTFPML